MRYVWTVLDVNGGYPTVRVYSNEKIARSEAARACEAIIKCGEKPNVLIQRQAVWTGKD
jgi:hypothetical protein